MQVLVGIGGVKASQILPQAFQPEKRVYRVEHSLRSRGAEPRLSHHPIQANNGKTLKAA
jgi:hypothetical protein